MKPFFLFLDFDGVLHSDGEGARLFEHAGRLGSALTRFPDVRVVISSSWRELHPLDELREFCGPVLGSRVIGVTPLLRRRLEGAEPELRLHVGGHAPLLRRSIDATQPCYERFEEISVWLALEAPVSAERSCNPLHRNDWVAIDDSDFWFPPVCPQFIHVANGLGLDDRHLANLETRLRCAEAL